FTGTHQWLVMTIREGRSRQIHRMCDAVGLQVIKLARVAFAGISYYGLKVGQSRFLDPQEGEALHKLATEGPAEHEEHRAARPARRAKGRPVHRVRSVRISGKT